MKASATPPVRHIADQGIRPRIWRAGLGAGGASAGSSAGRRRLSGSLRVIMPGAAGPEAAAAGLKVVRSALCCGHCLLAARGGRALGGNLPGGTGKVGFAAFEQFEPDL